MIIYDDYGDEPEDRFIPIPEALADQFYDLEMESYRDDGLFYSSYLDENSNILELGCGSGRVGRCLLGDSRIVTGVDISLSMLKKAKAFAVPSARFLAMDMTALAFASTFDAIIIPYNTLNLLVTRERIVKCLQGCVNYLKPGGILMAQVFLPTEKFINQGKKSFQFQILPLSAGGRLIKEILKEYQPVSRTVCIEERFRFRPEDMKQKADYNTSYTVAGLGPLEWLDLFDNQGLTVEQCYSDFTKTPSAGSDSPNLIVICSKKRT